MNDKNDTKTGGIEVPKLTKIDYIRDLIKNCKFDDALEQLEILQEEEPDNYEVLYELGRIYFELGDYQSAIANYEDLLKYNQSAIFYFNLGMAYEANDEIDRAISSYLKCLTVNEKFPFAYKKLGVLFLARNDKESAKEYFEDYLEQDVPESEKEAIRLTLERIK